MEDWFMNRSNSLSVIGLVVTLTATEAGAAPTATLAPAALAPTSGALYTDGTTTIYQYSQPGPRLALSAASAAAMSTQDLVQGGYPLPHGAPGSAAYSSWLQQVAKPATVLPGAPLILTNARFTTQTTESLSNWSGVEMTTTNGLPYVEAIGAWEVPYVAISAFNSFAAEWVGIDGDSCRPAGTNDLLQMGTATYSVNESRQTWAWVEFVPLEAALSLSNWITISPQDSVGVETFIGNNSGTPTTAGPNAFYLFQDNTPNPPTTTGWLGQNVSVCNCLPIVGGTAEAIVENPQVNGSVTNLADVGNMSIGLLAIDQGANLHDFNSDNTVVIDMCTSTSCSSNSGCNLDTEMCTSWQSNDDTASFEWENWN
jgi:hypothetical protein